MQPSLHTSLSACAFLPHATFSSMRLSRACTCLSCNSCLHCAECTNQPNVPRRAELEQWIDIELKLWPQNQQVKGLRMLLAGEVSAATYIRSYQAVV